MNRIDKLFKEKREKVLSIYFMAGYPELDDTITIIETLEKSGVDMIEVGIPFSDPVVDGSVIQESNKQALENGMTLKLLFEQLENIRTSVSIPIILMGYINPMLQYGVERFCKQCKRIGIDGLIIPDLPVFEYTETYKAVFDKYGLYHIFLITPQTSEARIREIDKKSGGFIYMVSSSSTTGAKTSISEEQAIYFEKVKTMELTNPTMIGFGISNNETFNIACENANGAIIGSAFISALSSGPNLQENIRGFVKSIIR